MLPDFYDIIIIVNTNKPILIVGLGNPGEKYARTRHNAGFIAVDALAGADAVWKKEKNSLVTKSQKFIFAKPQTFMNLSGQAALALMTFYKVPLENLVVIHDDMDLKLGDVRQKIGGGSAGHNGIKSIDVAVGREYKRIRIGIGRPALLRQPEKGTGFLASLFGLRAPSVPHPSMSPSDWVLGKFSAEEIKTVKEVADNIEIV